MRYFILLLLVFSCFAGYGKVEWGDNYTKVSRYYVGLEYVQGGGDGIKAYKQYVHNETGLENRLFYFHGSKLIQVVVEYREIRDSYLKKIMSKLMVVYGGKPGYQKSKNHDEYVTTLVETYSWNGRTKVELALCTTNMYSVKRKDVVITYMSKLLISQYERLQSRKNVAELEL